MFAKCSFHSLMLVFDTCISALGLGMASCMYIDPNKGSRAPSVSSMRDRASGSSRACLRATSIRSEWVSNNRKTCKTLSMCSHLFCSSRSISWDFFFFTSLPTMVWTSSRWTPSQESRTSALSHWALQSSVISYRGECHTGDGRPRWRRTAAGRTGTGRSEVGADWVEGAGPAPARSSWCHRCTGR